MTWTYSGDPSSSNRDEIRFLVGDTDTTDQLVNDEEVAYAVLHEANNQLAAARVARAIAAKFSRKSDKMVGDLKIFYSQQAIQYEALAVRLTESGNISGAMPYAGGISISDKQTVAQNSDRFQPAFKRGRFDFNENTVDDSFDPVSEQ